MSNHGPKWFVSWLLATAAATVIATVFVLGVIYTGFGVVTSLDKTEDIAKLQADVADLRAKLRDSQNAEHRGKDAAEAPSESAPPRTFKIGPPEPDAAGYSVEVRFRDRGIYLVYRDGRIFALRSKCSYCPEAHHTVNWLEAEQKFKCPRCGGGFYMTGERFEGRAVLALERCGIAIAEDGQIEIDVGRTFRKESGQWDRPDAFVAPWGGRKLTPPESKEVTKTEDRQVEPKPTEPKNDKESQGGAKAEDSPVNSDKEDPQRAKAAQDKDLQELEKRSHEEFVAQCQETDRYCKQSVKANPRDIRAWRLLGWNRAYNLSVTSDDVKERYGHVRWGIEHLIEGLGHNPTDARLYQDIAQHLLFRIGRSDERKPFRALFRRDKDFHKVLAAHVDVKAAAGPDGLPDSFLVAGRWYEKTIAIVEKHGPTPEFEKLVPRLHLYSSPAACQRGYARAIEDDGHFGEAAVNAWRQAMKMWEALGEREFGGDDGMKYRLKDNETARKVVNYDYWKKLAQSEQTERVLAARRAVYRAEDHLTQFKGLGRWPWEENLATRRAEFTDEARDKAKRLYHQAFRAWAEAFKEHAWLIDDDGIAEDLADVVRRYQTRVLKSKELPKDFPLGHIKLLLVRIP
jgi:cytochrome b6-f complex iron-sulfur subunit